MTRDENIARAMPKITNAGHGDLALLGMASDLFIEQMAQLAGDIEARFEDSRYREFDETIACGRLMARADAQPGITLFLEMGERTSYQMRSIWTMGVRMPSTLSIGLVGKMVAEVVELPGNLPSEIRDGTIREVWDCGSRKTGYSTRFDLDQPRWRSLDLSR